MESNKVFALDQTTIKKLLTIYKLIIPDFQRNFVWKQSKKQQLLESLFRGFPIGAITLYEDNDGYYIIDGLQRINTLNQYFSSPNKVISFNKFFEKVEEDIKFFIEEYNLIISMNQIKSCIKKWYENLSNLYEYEKLSLLYGAFRNESNIISEQFGNPEIIEELLSILKSKIDIVHDDIVLIIYRGNKNDLPDLFKNINTGSVALSQYEILQSVWNDYTLDMVLLKDTSEAFDRELDIIKNDYEINAVKEVGRFDIFKNIMGLNHLICCKEDADILFRFSTFKKLNEPICFEENRKKYFANDSIAFEMYSTILCGSSNQIVKAVDLIYRSKEDNDKISRFVKMLNDIIIESVDTAIKEIKNKKSKMIESKYHSLYVLAGIIFSKYDINTDDLYIKEYDVNNTVFNEALNIENHRINKWFLDENRQVGFFNIKIEELMDMRKRAVNNTLINGEKLEIKINKEIIEAYTVKEFYNKIFVYLLSNSVDLESVTPYATGNKRYLINRTNKHINGNIFVSPIKVGNYYIETHKSKNGALRDIYKFLKEIGVDVGYIK